MGKYYIYSKAINYEELMQSNVHLVATVYWHILPKSFYDFLNCLREHSKENACKAISSDDDKKLPFNKITLFTHFLGLNSLFLLLIYYVREWKLVHVLLGLSPRKSTQVTYVVAIRSWYKSVSRCTSTSRVHHIFLRCFKMML